MRAPSTTSEMHPSRTTTSTGPLKPPPSSRTYGSRRTKLCGSRLVSTIVLSSCGSRRAVACCAPAVRPADDQIKWVLACQGGRRPRRRPSRRRARRDVTAAERADVVDERPLLFDEGEVAALLVDHEFRVGEPVRQQLRLPG